MTDEMPNRTFEHEQEHHHHEGGVIHYVVDAKHETATVSERTPTEILELAGDDPSERFLVEIKGDRRESYHDHPHKPIRLHDGQVFETSHRDLHFTVDDEVVVSRDHDLPPVKIMEMSGVDSKNHYLIRICGDEESFRDAPDAPIRIHQNDKFITLMMAPTPVS